MKPEDRIKAYNNYMAKYRLLGLTPYDYIVDLEHAEFQLVDFIDTTKSEYIIPEFTTSIDTSLRPLDNTTIKLIYKGDNLYSLREFLRYSFAEYIDLSEMNLETVNDFSYAFSDCNMLISIKWPENQILTNLKYAQFMFYRCNSLNNIDLSLIVSDQIKVLTGMFKYCTNVKSINIENIEFTNARHIEGLCYECRSLKRIKFSNKIADKLLNLESLFYDCENLEYIDISFIHSGRDMTKTFFNCFKLRTINICNISPDSFIETFANCNKLENIIINLNSIDFKTIIFRRTFIHCHKLSFDLVKEIVRMYSEACGINIETVLKTLQVFDHLNQSAYKNKRHEISEYILQRKAESM